MDPNTKTIGIIIACIIALVIFLGGAYFFTSGSSSQGSDFPYINVIKSTDHITWSPAKKNILVEYSDFECPACKAYHDIINTIEASNSADFQITRKITYVVRDFPLFQIHPNAMVAAYAAEAAGKQGKFFEMGDLLFKNQDSWASLPDPADYFVTLATQLHLNIDRFKKNMNSDSVKQKVNDDMASGNKAGINATPTFFLNGHQLTNIQSADQFKQLLLNVQ